MASLGGLISKLKQGLNIKEPTKGSVIIKWLQDAGLTDSESDSVAVIEQLVAEEVLVASTPSKSVKKTLFVWGSGLAKFNDNEDDTSEDNAADDKIESSTDTNASTTEESDCDASTVSKEVSDTASSSNSSAEANKNSQSSSASTPPPIDLMDGEEIEWQVAEVSTNGHPETFNGRIIVTNYRLAYLDQNGNETITAPLAMIWSASKIDKKKKDKRNSASKGKHASAKGCKKLELILKDQRVYYFFFKRSAIDELLERFKGYVAGMPMTLFCWKNRTKYSINGWTIYDPIKEYQRMGVPNLQWRITELNKDWQLSDTYPRILVVPAAVDDETLKVVAQFRSRGRIPALAYRHPNGATITRCSQPAVGMSRKRCREDERFLYEIAQTNPQTDVLPILDARPKANAMANIAMGYGFEIVSHYPKCTLTFCDIENIHVMRNSLFKVRELLYTPDDGKWLASLDVTGWLTHQYMILSSAVKIADLVHNQCTSVLIHCTDGWDRTSQLVSLASLMLDPYYRTIEGFQVLIEKDWLSFGHRFGMRHAIDGKESSDRAPIFQQFIEVTWQITQQYPTHFEFSEKYLIELLDELYACRFGTFLFDCEKERFENNAHKNTPSVWSYLHERRAELTNPLYQPNQDVIIPSASSRRLHFWEAYYFRHHPEIGLPVIPTPVNPKTPSPQSCASAPAAGNATSAAAAAAATPRAANTSSPKRKKNREFTRAKDDSSANLTSNNGTGGNVGVRLRSMTTSKPTATTPRKLTKKDKSTTTSEASPGREALMKSSK